MSLLSAVIPDIPEARAEVIPARLARKVAPLFGVPWPNGPFAPRTWVCDYNKITLSEIARGAPLPTRSQARNFDLDPDLPWQVIDRVAVTTGSAPLPYEIANATLTRFGPDTKAAVILSAVNRLLAPVTKAIETALSLLVAHDGAALPAELRLAAWAGLVAETFRSQPALMAAAIRARTIQRELVVSWRLPLSGDPAGLRLTRCEISPADGEDGDESPAAEHPQTLDVADRSFQVLRVSGWGNRQTIPDIDPGADERGADDRTSSELARRLLREEVVDVLLRRLLDVGTSNDASYLWLSERMPGQLAVEALVPPTGLIDLFVQYALRSLSVDNHMSVARTTALPRIPSTDELGDLDTLTRRTVIIALLTVLRHIQHSPETREATRHHIVPLLDDIGDLARRSLTENDPVGALACCRVADMKVHTLRYDTRNDLRGPLAELRAQLRRVQELFRAGTIDRGAAAEAISSANVEINIVRWTNAVVPEAGLPNPDELNDELRHGWKIFHEALEIEPGSGERAAGYHLHNYAAFLASSPSGDEDDLHEAVRLFADIVILARRAFFERTGSFLPLRNSLQVASRATTRLAETARSRGNLVAAVRSAELGHGWIRRALADDEARRILNADPPTELASRLALLAAPALLIAVETGVPGVTTEDFAMVRNLVDLVQRWDRSVGDAHHARHSEAVALQARLDALAI
jgi:hypothetical protein